MHIFVVLIQPLHPIWHPTASRFQKSDFQLWETLEDTATDDAHSADHLFERMPGCVDEKRIVKSVCCRRWSARAHMDAHGDAMLFSRCTGSNIPVVNCGLRDIGAVPMPQPTPLGFAQIFPSNKSSARPLASFTTRGACFLYGSSNRSCHGASFSCTWPSASMILRLFM